MTLDLTIWDKPPALGGKRIARWNGVRGLKCSTAERGFERATGFVPLPRAEATRWYGWQSVAHVEITARSGSTIWEGRLEDVKVTSDGIVFVAYGYIRAFSDVLHTAVWSKTNYDGWVEVTPSMDGSCLNDRFNFATKDRLYITPTKNTAQANQGGFLVTGALGWRIPNRSTRGLLLLTYDYTLVAPTTWRGFAQRRTASWGFVETPWVPSGTGGTLTGSQTLTLAGSTEAIFFGLQDTNFGNVFGGETGSVYLEIRNLRLRSVTTSVTADLIARDLLANVRAVNPSQLHPSERQITAHGLDLKNEEYADSYGAPILDRLSRIADLSGTTYRQWETGVWEDRAIHFRPRSGGRRWLVDVDLDDFAVERTLDTLRNAAYAVYESSSREAVRTLTNRDALITRQGIERQVALGVRTTDPNEATTNRDALLQDRRNPRPRATIAIRRIVDADTRVPWPLYHLRAQDTVTARNLSPMVASDVERLRTFRVIETDYDADTGEIDVTPELPTPQLDLIAARRDAGY